jgi:cyclohexadieny/prephenate dehydrogenase
VSIQRVALIGAGHIGASIARAAALKLPDVRVTLFDASPDVRERAQQIGLGAIAPIAEEAVRDADLVMLCVPVGAMGAAYNAIAPALRPGAILSDVGSVKNAVIGAVTPRADIFFVPGHPLAGTEQSGPDAGLPQLFENRWLILTPLADPRPEYQDAVAQLSAFWTALGANVEAMDAARHDVVLAVVSHLPHLIAYNIVAMAEDLEHITETEVVKYSASGFRDFTRIAASDPTMWRDVFLNNKEAVLEVLGRFTEDLTALQRAIRDKDGQKLYDTFARARRVRREIIDAGQDSAAPNFGRDQKA